MVVILCLGLLAFAGLIALQARAITRSLYPMLTAITPPAFSIPPFTLLFATTYLIEKASSKAFPSR